MLDLSLDMISAVAEGLPFRLVLTVIVFASFGIYNELNKSGGRADVLVTAFDRRIVLWPVFSVPYLLYFPFLFLVTGYGILFSRHSAEIAASALGVQLVAAVIYGYRQTHVPRPPVPGRDVFSRLAACIYGFDRPYCAFPSLHVAYSVLCAYWAAVLFGPVLTAAGMVLTAAIVLSTLYLKQHVIADVFGGAALAVLCLLVVV